ncbi:hypothetical protein OQ486_00500 [Plesiomonas shigelloides]|uniref:hypothetical protein n=1 Tax=Plesiomonas shigelloides TaxID=703 RepID=UPI002245FB37|nr:hypothetical protein [Plesiomonas shigelloides]MCX2531991.1 hypothetical protein [Plesiomonas shigelloides]
MRGIILSLVALALAVICVMAGTHSVTEFNPVLAILLVVWLLPQAGLRGGLLVAVITLFAGTLAAQPISLTAATLMAYPMLAVLFSRHAPLSLKFGLFIPWVAMPSAIMALQNAGGIPGSPWVTLCQFLAVAAVWLICRGWRAPAGNFMALLVVAIPFSLWLPMQTLAVLSLIGLIAAVQMLQKGHYAVHLYRLGWLLPTLPFAVLALYPVEQISLPILMMWLVLLLVELMGESLLEENEQENNI